MAEVARYYQTGKRKTAIARVWLMPGSGKITVNRQPLDSYFRLETHTTIIREPLTLTDMLGQFDALVTSMVAAWQAKQVRCAMGLQKPCCKRSRPCGLP
jgi:ribosomal protein S9